MFWYAVYTSARFERKVDAHLSKEGMTTFLPEIERWSRRKDRKKRVLCPHFPRILVHQRGCQLRAIKIRGVVGILGSNGTPAVSAEKQIDVI
jgi:transcription antitermination factor NusG